MVLFRIMPSLCPRTPSFTRTTGPVSLSDILDCAYQPSTVVAVPNLYNWSWHTNYLNPGLKVGVFIDISSTIEHNPSSTFAQNFLPQAYLDNLR